MDPTSRELLDLIIERIRSMPVLLIVTFRPEFQPPWTGQEQVSTLALNRLDRHDRRALVEQIGDGKALPDNVVAQIAERTDGVPLFVEELTKNVLESGLLRVEADRYVLDGALPAFAIPTSLHASLLGRLDRLGSVRDVAQIAAAIGRQFPYTLLRAACRLPEDELQGSLARLVASELVSQRGTPPEAVYVFKHALVRDAAYGSRAMPAGSCMCGSQMRSKPTPPRLQKASPSSSHSITPRPGSLKNPSPIGVRRLRGPPPALQWRRRPRNFKKGWISWRCCQTTPIANDRNSNLVVAWQRCSKSSKAMALRRRATPTRKRWSCGSAWVVPLSSFTFPGESHDTTSTTANSIWRCSWPTVCCIEAANTTIRPAWFSATIPPVTTCCSPGGLHRAARIWKRCLRCTIRSPTAP
jgi:hypothetical protein